MFLPIESHYFSLRLFGWPWVVPFQSFLETISRSSRSGSGRRESISKERGGKAASYKKGTSTGNNMFKKGSSGRSGKGKYHQVARIDFSDSDSSDDGNDFISQQVRNQRVRRLRKDESRSDPQSGRWAIAIASREFFWDIKLSRRSLQCE